MFLIKDKVSPENVGMRPSLPKKPVDLVLVKDLPQRNITSTIRSSPYTKVTEYSKAPVRAS